MNQQILYTGAWGLVNLIAGFVLGQAVAWRRHRRDDGTSVVVPAIVDNSRRKRYFGAFLVVLAVGTMAQTTYYNYEQSKCNNAFRAAIENRSGIQRSDNANVIQLFTDITDDISTDPPLTDAERAAFIGRFQERAAENARNRAANPYPAQECG